MAYIKELFIGQQTPEIDTLKETYIRNLTRNQDQGIIKLCTPPFEPEGLSKCIRNHTHKYPPKKTHMHSRAQRQTHLVLYGGVPFVTIAPKDQKDRETFVGKAIQVSSQSLHQNSFHVCVHSCMYMTHTCKHITSTYKDVDDDAKSPPPQEL